MGKIYSLAETNVTAARNQNDQREYLPGDPAVYMGSKLGKVLDVGPFYDYDALVGLKKPYALVRFINHIDRCIKITDQKLRPARPNERANIEKRLLERGI